MLWILSCFILSLLLELRSLISFNGAKVYSPSEEDNPVVQSVLFKAIFLVGTQHQKYPWGCCGSGVWVTACVSLSQRHAGRDTREKRIKRIAKQGACTRLLLWNRGRCADPCGCQPRRVKEGGELTWGSKWSLSFISAGGVCFFSLLCSREVELLFHPRLYLVIIWDEWLQQLLLFNVLAAHFGVMKLQYWKLLP